MIENHIIPGHEPVSPNNHGPLVSVLTWFLLVPMSLAVIAKLTIRGWTGTLRWKEDTAVCVAASLGITQAIVTSIEAESGLGKHQHSLPAADVVKIFELQYIVDLLYVATLCVSQIGFLQLVEWLAVSRKMKRVVQGATWFTLAWGVVAFLVLAIREGVQRPWNTQSSPANNPHIFWVAVTCLSAITELVAMGLPLWIIRPLQMPLGRKLSVATAFCSRIFVLAALLIRMAVFPAAPSAESDLTFNLVSFALASQATLSFTVTMQCIPSLKPVLDAFATGLLEVSLYGRAGEEARNMSSGNKYELGSIHRSFAHSAMVTSSAGVRESGPIARPQEKAERPPHRVLNRDRSRDSGRSDELGIVKTAAWEIRYQPMDGQEGEEYACSSSASGFIIPRLSCRLCCRGLDPTQHCRRTLRLGWMLDVGSKP